MLEELDARAADVPEGAVTLFLQVTRLIGGSTDVRLVDGVVAATRRLLRDAPGVRGAFELRRPELSLFGIWFSATEAPFRVHGSESHVRWSAWARRHGDALGVFNVRLRVEDGRVPVPSRTFEVLLAMGLLL